MTVRLQGTPSLSDTSATILPLTGTASGASASRAYARPVEISFNRDELSQILHVYGRMVASGEWRDYAIDALREKAVFSVYRRTSETPLYRIEKTPKLARRQGAYAVVSASGHVLKRGRDLGRVLRVFDKGLRLVD